MKILLAVLLSLLPALGVAGQWSAIEGRFACPALDNSLACALQIEAALEHPPIQRGADNALRVTLDNGHQMRLGTAESIFVALELLPRRRLLVIFEQLPEGGRFGWLDLATGAYRRLPGYPLFAPEGDLVVMAEQDVEAGYSPNVLQIHRYANGSLQQVQTVETPDWGPAQVRWTGARSLSFRKVSFECAIAGIDTCPEVELEHVGPGQ